MNIDERLEALTHSVELLPAMHKDSGTRMQQWIQGTEKRIEATEKRIQANEKQMKRFGRHVLSVLHMVLDHETRLRDIEGDDEDDDANSALISRLGLSRAAAGRFERLPMPSSMSLLPCMALTPD